MSIKIAKQYRKKMKNSPHPWINDSPESRLMQCADCYGMTPKGVAQFADLLAGFKLKPEDITDHIISKAIRLDRQWDSHIQRMTQPRSRPQASPTTKTEPTTSKAATAPKKAPQPRKAKDAFGSREGSMSHKLNDTILNGGATSAQEMSELSKIAIGRCKAHVKWLADRDLITGDFENFEIA